eukprot:scaffold63292_cov70-Phaeocystis_antarctica.AAC.3
MCSSSDCKEVSPEKAALHVSTDITSRVTWRKASSRTCSLDTRTPKQRAAFPDEVDRSAQPSTSCPGSRNLRSKLFASDSAPRSPRGSTRPPARCEYMPSAPRRPRSASEFVNDMLWSTGARKVASGH